MILFDEKETLSVTRLPKNKLDGYIYVSDDGEYLVVKLTELLAKDLLIIYYVPAMEIDKKIYLDYICMVRLLRNKKTLLIGTWKGIFQKEI